MNDYTQGYDDGYDDGFGAGAKETEGGVVGLIGICAAVLVIGLAVGYFLGRHLS